MTKIGELLRQGKTKEVWQRCCGFIDLSLEEFMQIQKRLLMEQIDLLGKCELGRKIMGDKVPGTVEEFRKIIPLTTYAEYAPYLLEKKEDILIEKPYLWLRTSGRSGEYKCKWVPYTRRMFDKVSQAYLGALIFGSCSGREEVFLDEGDVYLFTLAPLPYITGALARAILSQIEVAFIPPIDKAERMGFQERIEEGFKIGLKTGIDIMFGLASIIARVGEQFSEGPRGSKMPPSFLFSPKVLYRLTKGVLKSKIAKRNLLPKDIWKVKTIQTAGMDTPIFRDRIEHYWGRQPLEGYAATEAPGVAIQTWDFKGMTFFPDINFLEFIPEQEHIKSKQDPDYQPRTLLLDEVKPGIYEMVITNFYGGVFVRYRIGDLIRIISLRNEELGIDIPQMIFHSRGDDVIDLAGFTRLTERAIWQAIEDSGIKYVDWTARKEYVDQDKPSLHLYIELKGKQGNVKDLIRESLKKIDTDYADLEEMLKIDPLKVTLLSEDTFKRYLEEMRKAGADPAQLKPPRMNPSDKVLENLLRLS